MIVSVLVLLTVGTVLAVVYLKPSAKVTPSSAAAAAAAADSDSAAAVAVVSNVEVVAEDDSPAGPVSLDYQLQHEKMAPSDFTGANNDVGESIDISADGNTLVAGANGDDNNRGAAWIFVRSGSTWAQQGLRLRGSDGDGGNQYQGYSVALSADGNTMASGAYNENKGQGAVWVFVRTGTSWAQQGNKLVGTGGISVEMWQGYSVALSADGNTLAIGAFVEDNFQGAVWIFTRSGTTWTQQARVSGTGGVGDQYQGSAVALSSDGNTLAVSGRGDNGNIGAVWIFTRGGITWTQQGLKLTPNDGVGTPRQGAALALSGDGNTVIAGGYSDNTNVGAVWVFRRNVTDQWEQDGTKIIPPDDALADDGELRFGREVALSTDGIVLAVAATSDSVGNGTVWGYVDNGDGFTLATTKFRPPDADAGIGVADALALSTDGATLAMGVRNEDANLGAAWIYVNADAV